MSPMSVDTIWGGTYSSIDAISFGKKIFVAYYNGKRYLTITSIDTESNHQVTVTTNVIFKGWDSHNSIVLAADKDGNIHIAGNVHAQPLIYGRTKTPGDLTTLEVINFMDGVNENKVTYPKFIKRYDNELFFFYRNGGSGSGDHVLKMYTDTGWKTVVGSFFNSSSSKNSLSAYPFLSARDKLGVYHMTWVWRESTDARTNFDVNYAQSRDLIHWSKSNGDAYSLPIVPKSAELVDKVSSYSGLMNDIKTGWDTEGRPIFSYVKFDEMGKTQLYHARRENSKWSVIKGSNWDFIWDLAGHGTRYPAVRFSGVRTKLNGDLAEDVYTEGQGWKEYVYDQFSIQNKSINRIASPRNGHYKHLRVETEANKHLLQENSISIRNESSMIVRGRFIWLTFPPDNSDMPPTCVKNAAIDRCDFSSQLQFHDNAPSK